MTLRQLLVVTGSTHASRVIPALKSSDALSATDTRLDEPLNETAPPYLPAFDQAPFSTVPLLPRPEVSDTTVPEPSSKEYAATRPVAAAWELRLVAPKTSMTST